jgi:putative RecB family exonuclease
MTSLENLTGKDYVSHSAMTTWLNCGWNYYLSRVQNVAENPSYWLVGGKSVHTCTEIYDLGDYIGDFNPQEVFLNQWNKEYELSNNGMPFRAGGRATKAYPNKEDASWWLAEGPKMVDFWVQWREASGYQPFIMPDGRPAVETELLDEIKGVKVRGYLDRLMVSPEGELTVIDIKSSSKPPSSNAQLGIYATLVDKIFGIRPTKGAYWMSRTGELTEPVDLSHYTESKLGAHLNGFKKAVENNIFLPNPGFMCGTCSVNKACYAVNGADSHLYPELTESEV